MDPRFIQQMMSIGILSYREQERVWEIARRCAGTAGVPMAGGLAVLAARGGTVTLPGIGTVTGAAAGALVGLVLGTATCTALNLAVRDELRALARGH